MMTQKPTRPGKKKFNAVLMKQPKRKLLLAKRQKS